MPVSGLVVSLRDEPLLRAQTLAEIGQHPQITIGIVDQNRLAIVVDTMSSQEDKQLWDWLGSLSGVSFLSRNPATIPTHFSGQPLLRVRMTLPSCSTMAATTGMGLSQWMKSQDGHLVRVRPSTSAVTRGVAHWGQNLYCIFYHEGHKEHKGFFLTLLNHFINCSTRDSPTL